MCSLNNWKRIRPFIISLWALISAEGVVFKCHIEMERGGNKSSILKNHSCKLCLYHIFLSLFFPIISIISWSSFFLFIKYPEYIVGDRIVGVYILLIFHCFFFLFLFHRWICKESPLCHTVTTPQFTAVVLSNLQFISNDLRSKWMRYTLCGLRNIIILGTGKSL